MAGAAADQSTEYRAPTLGFAQLTTTEMENGANSGNRGTESSEEDLGDPINGAAEQPHQATVSTPENNLMATMQEMMKQQMEMSTACSAHQPRKG